MEPKIRNARKEDIPQLVKLYHRVKEIPDYPGQKHTKEYFLSFIKSKNKVVVVVEAGKKIVGALNGEFDPQEKYFYLTNIVVSKNYRNKGIGRMLLNRGELITSRRKYKQVICCVYEWNKNMQAIIEHYNYKPKGKLILYTKGI